MSLTGFLSYSRVNWQQSPSKSTPLSAANLNVMDAGIKNNNDMIGNLRDEVTQLNSDIEFSTLVRKAKNLEPNTDLNTITTSGIYYLPNAATWGNAPNTKVTNSYLIVIAFNTKSCTQILLPGNDTAIYIRSTYTDNTLWTNWKCNDKQVGVIEMSKSMQYSLNGKLVFALLIVGGNIYLASTDSKGTATYVTSLKINETQITCTVNEMTLTLTNNTNTRKPYLIKIM